MKSLQLLTSKNILLATCMMALACNNNTLPANLHSADADTDDRKEESPQRTRQAGNFMKFIQHKVYDRQATGKRASGFLIPEGWTVNDSLFWLYTDPVVPVRYAATCESRDHSQKIEVYPDYRESWSRGLMRTQGQKPPSGIIAALKQIVAYRRPGLDIIYTQQKVIPGAAMPATQQNGISGKTTSERGFVRFEYSKNGKSFEEVMYGLLETSQISTMGANNPDAITWSLSELLGCTAQKGKLENCKKIALTMRASSHMTLSFYNRLVQVVQLLRDQYYQQIFAAGEISKIISKTNDQVLQTISDSYRNTQQSYDRINQQFSDYVRGVDRYSDGRSELQLPSGYSNAWVNDNNEYFLSDQSGFDPNRTMGGDWKQLDRR